MSPAKNKPLSKKEAPPRAVRLILEQLSLAMMLEDPLVPGQKIGDSVGVYAYYDFDEEPIYVGQTSSTFRDRVGRHLTGQRSDAVGKFILDPFEVAEVALYSVPAVVTLRHATDATKEASTAAKKKLLNPYEYTVYEELRRASQFGAVLNEQSIKPTELVELPAPIRVKIIPADMWADRSHRDVRIARRASTLARLAQSTSERQVSPGLRRTLLLQAERLAWLTKVRVAELGIAVASADEAVIPLGGDDSE